VGEASENQDQRRGVEESLTQTQFDVEQMGEQVLALQRKMLGLEERIRGLELMLARLVEPGEEQEREGS
jgi:hypothetical protein